MTMADTVAVMNAGRIDQMGPPEELYEHPATTFVANFLGQSNLVSGQVRSAQGGDLELDVHGTTLRARKVSSGIDNGEVWVGVRPEKVSLVRRGMATPASSTNVLTGGVLTDISFVGVSTQFLVRMPWGQELTVFVQNTGDQERLAHGDQVDLCWDPVHTFCLDAAQDASAGVDQEDA